MIGWEVYSTQKMKVEAHRMKGSVRVSSNTEQSLLKLEDNINSLGSFST